MVPPSPIGLSITITVLSLQVHVGKTVATKYCAIQFNLFRQSCTIEYNIIYIYTFTIDKPSCKLD